MTTTPTDCTWRELFPEGRDLFYDGDDPDGFAAEIKARFGFDPSKSPTGGRLLWGVPVTLADGELFTAYPFACPPEHLDAIYPDASGYPVGS
jgi:hypothetical protein